MFIGSKMTGGVPQLSKKDGKAVLVSSVLQTATGSTAAVIVDFTLTNPVSSYVDPQLRFVTKSDIASTQMLYLYNNTTKKWDFVRSNGLGTKQLEVVAPLPEVMGSYITVQGKIRALLRTHVPVTRGRSVASYRLHIDQAIFESQVKL